MEALLVFGPLLLSVLTPEDQRHAKFAWDYGPHSAIAMPAAVREAFARESVSYSVHSTTTRAGDSIRIYRFADSSEVVVTSGAGDSIRTYQFPDSSEVVVTTNGEIRSVRLARHTEELVASLLGPPIAELAKAMHRLLWIAAAIYLPIPLALGALTLAWWVQRRRMMTAPVD